VFEGGCTVTVHTRLGVVAGLVFASMAWTWTVSAYGCVGNFGGGLSGSPIVQAKTMWPTCLRVDLERLARADWRRIFLK
jgi:hypothetical protein